MKDLFTQFDRTTRQKICIQNWLKAGMKATIVAATGVGKTRIALMTIKALLSKYPNMRFLIVVPTETLQNQWQEQLDAWDVLFNCEVKIINSASKQNYVCDVLIIDEIHRSAANTLLNVFNTVKYRYIMGLTATFERLDERDQLVAKYAPVCDTISTEEALLNGWIAPYKEYVVLIDVPDMDIYNEYNRQFTESFGFFNFRFDLVMKMIGKDGYKTRLAYRDYILPSNATSAQKSDTLKTITYHAMNFMRAMQNRKKFINNHPKKVEIAQKIIKARSDRKIITFSNNVKMAEAIENGKNVYTGKISKKKGRIMIDDFNKLKTGCIHSCQKLNEGADIKGLSVAIMLGLDSSKIKAVQKRGRVIRLEDGKTAELFNLIIKDSVEQAWFKKSHENDKYIIIDEKGLDKVLNGEEPDIYKKPIQKFAFRF